MKAFWHGWCFEEEEKRRSSRPKRREGKGEDPRCFTVMEGTAGTAKSERFFMGTTQQRRLRIDVWISLALMLVFSFFYMNIDGWVIETLPATIAPAEFPTLVTAILIVMSGLLGVISFRALRVEKGRSDEAERAGDCDLVCECEEGLNSKQVISLFSYMGVLTLYLIGLHYIGFVYSTPAIMLLVAKMLGLKNWFACLVCYIAFAVALNYFVFEFMHVILPSGVLFE